MTDDTESHTSDKGAPEWTALDRALGEPVPLEHYAAPVGPNPMDTGPAFRRRLAKRRAKNRVAKQSRKKNRRK